MLCTSELCDGNLGRLQVPPRVLLQRRASSVASPNGNTEALLRSPRQSTDGTERAERRLSSAHGLQRNVLVPQSPPTMTDATGLVSWSAGPMRQSSSQGQAPISNNQCGLDKVLS